LTVGNRKPPEGAKRVPTGEEWSQACVICRAQNRYTPSAGAEGGAHFRLFGADEGADVWACARHVGAARALFDQGDTNQRGA
jgi:hypothetical protein